MNEKVKMPMTFLFVQENQDTSSAEKPTRRAKKQLWKDTNMVRNFVCKGTTLKAF